MAAPRLYFTTKPGWKIRGGTPQFANLGIGAPIVNGSFWNALIPGTAPCYTLSQSNPGSNIMVSRAQSLSGCPMEPPWPFHFVGGGGAGYNVAVAMCLGIWTYKLFDGLTIRSPSNTYGQAPYNRIVSHNSLASNFNTRFGVEMPVAYVYRPSTDTIIDYLWDNSRTGTPGVTYFGMQLANLSVGRVSSPEGDTWYQGIDHAVAFEDGDIFAVECWIVSKLGQGDDPIHHSIADIDATLELGSFTMRTTNAIGDGELRTRAPQCSVGF